MKTVILAAGYATRLYPLTENKPKALLPVGSKPLINHLIDKVNGVGQNDEVILVSNDRFVKQFEEWRPNSGCSKRLRVINDGTTSNDNRLGAIGDLRFAIQKCEINDDILMLASDNLFEMGLDAYTRFASSRRDGGTIGVFDLKDPALGAGRYGIVQVGEASHITEIQEKPENPQSSLASMGIYYFPKFSLKFVDEYMSSESKQDAPGYFVTWLMQKMPMYAFAFHGRWYDIGSVDQLEQASRFYAKEAE